MRLNRKQILDLAEALKENDTIRQIEVRDQGEGRVVFMQVEVKESFKPMTLNPRKKQQS